MEEHCDVCAQSGIIHWDSLRAPAAGLLQACRAQLGLLCCRCFAAPLATETPAHVEMGLVCVSAVGFGLLPGVLADALASVL